MVCKHRCCWALRLCEERIWEIVFIGNRIKDILAELEKAIITSFLQADLIFFMCSYSYSRISSAERLIELVAQHALNPPPPPQHSPLPTM